MEERCVTYNNSDSQFLAKRGKTTQHHAHDDPSKRCSKLVCIKKCWGGLRIFWQLNLVSWHRNDIKTQLEIHLHELKKNLICKALRPEHKHVLVKFLNQISD